MLQLRIKLILWEAPNILSYELRSTTEEDLPPFTAGAHIQVTLHKDMVRSYSILNSPSERHRYVIAVQKDRQGRGGSKWAHQNLHAGDILQVDGPHNNFQLNEDAEKTIFIAGGIGITPILSMVDRLRQLGRDYELIYCARTRATAPFVSILQEDERVRFNFDREPGGALLDIAAAVQAAPENAHIYCCGPTEMLDAFEDASRELDRERLHVEYFTSKEPPAEEGGFAVVLAKTGRQIDVAKGKTIMQALIDAGVAVRHSCIEGVCGTCETKVLEGVPDHRDRILTPAERASNQTMMVCCSGSKTEKLVLDL
jgi:tetrachlorobenzoquinone reductase